jgi:hypothetical protein
MKNSEEKKYAMLLLLLTSTGRCGNIVNTRFAGAGKYPPHEIFARSYACVFERK